MPAPHRASTPVDPVPFESHSGVVAPTADTGATVATATTATTADTGPTTWPLVPVRPQTTLVAVQAGEAVGRDVFDIGDTNADGLVDIVVSTRDRMLVLSPPLPAGRVEAASLASGTLPPALAETPFAVSSAGDTDHDGFGDVWFGTQLYRGPFVGYRERWDIEILDPRQFYVVAGFDADGDGWTDAAFHDHNSAFELHYGPFDADRPSRQHPDFDPANATVVEYGYRSAPHGMAIRDLAYPGQIVVTAGWGCCFGGYYYGSFVRFFDVSGPRGRTLQDADAFAAFPHSDYPGTFQVLPDADGDGLTDILYQLQPQIGPFLGVQPEWATGVLLFDQAGARAWALPDVTGDGLGDILVYGPGEPFAPEWYVVAGTLRGAEPRLELADVGVPLENPRGTNIQTWLSVDLDGDPYAELVAWDYTYGVGGEVWIWSGADLQAGFASLFPGHPASEAP